MNLDIIRLHFKTPLHIGNHKNAYDKSEAYIQSDTLYSAIINTWALLGKVDWIPKAESGRPVNLELGFTISSLFPFLGKSENEKPVYFFPKPFRLPRDKNNDIDPSKAKKIKKIKYLDLESFEKVINNETLIDEQNVYGGYKSNSLSIEKKDFISSGISDRIMRPRDESKENKIFYVERLYFKYDSGLFFIVKHDNEESRKRLYTALNLLQETGLGTDKTTGNGLFEYKTDTIDLRMPKSDYVTNLSLYYPKGKEHINDIFDDQTFYELVKRGGWMGEPYGTIRKKYVHMFSVGSVFKYPLSDIKTGGASIDLRPNEETLPKAIGHPVWRVGQALFIPIKTDEK